VQALKPGGLYFLMAFTAGWILGPIRVLFLTPRVGPVAAVLIEAPFMMTVSVLSARWIIRRWKVPATVKDRAAMGLVALALLLGAELASTIWLRGVPLSLYLQGFRTPFGLISLALYQIFGLIPLTVEQGRRNGSITAPGK
jgi:hypothetical protein